MTTPKNIDELLMLAAKAGQVFITPERFAKECSSPWGDEFNPRYDAENNCAVGWQTCYGTEGDIAGWKKISWNPLDVGTGEALRLAIKLNLHMGLEDGVANVWLGGMKHWRTVPHEGNPEYATCLAIVCVAAEIGRAMP